MPAKSLTAQAIWNTLSKIDCSGRTEEKGGLTYLPWSEAVTLMMENYPEYTVKWHGTADEKGVTRDVTYYEGGTASVACSITIGDVKRECWLPVMDYKNKAIAHPDSRSISDAKQRCLVKCFALFGLGIYIYRGDSLPEVAGKDEDTEYLLAERQALQEEGEVVKKVAPSSSKKAPKKKKSAPKKEAAPKEDAETIKTTLKVRCQELHDSGWAPDPSLAKDIKAACANLDGEKMKALLTMLDTAMPIAKQLNDDTLQGEVFDE